MRQSGLTATLTVTPTVTVTPAATATQPPSQPANLVRYTYDGSGSLVKREVYGVITYYPSRHYHKTMDEEMIPIQALITYQLWEE